VAFARKGERRSHGKPDFHIGRDDALLACSLQHLFSSLVSNSVATALHRAAPNSRANESVAEERGAVGWRRAQLTKFLEPLLEQIVFAQLPISLGALRDRVYLVSGRAAEAAANGGVLAGGVPPPPPPPSAEQQVEHASARCYLSWGNSRSPFQR
jgi:hypothetical protein